MDKLDITNKIMEYIETNNISIEQIARDTQISSRKLRRETKERLMATEFLRLCQYLNVRPEDFK